MQILDESSIYSNFIDSIASKFTKSGYANSLKMFMLYLKTEKYSDLVTMPHDRIFDSIKSYILHLKNSGMSTRSITIKLYALKCFYDMNDIEDIKWKKLKRFKGEESGITEDRAYTHEEIQQILNVSDLRTKVIVLLLASGGMRIGALPSLKSGSLRTVCADDPNSLDRHQNSVIVYAKTPQKYISFITPECSNTIKSYLEYRERCGEKITPDSPLLRAEFDTDFPEAARKKVNPLSREGCRKSIYKVLIKCGIREVDHVNPRARKEVMMAHGFRKFFRTQLLLSKVDSSVAEMLLGHSKKKLEFVYTRLTDTEMLLEYQKAIDSLTIDPANRLKRELVHEQQKNTETSKILARLAKLEGEIGIKI